MSPPLQLAYFTPLPPARTGIADYSLELLPPLAQRARIEVFSDQTDSSHAISAPVLPIADYASRRWQYDLPIYQMGNHVVHAAIGRTLLRYPGIMTLHDFGLHQLWAAQSLAAGQPAIYRREMAYALGPAGLQIARDVEIGRREPPHFEVALNDRFLRMALGVITHSRYAERLVLERVPNQLTAVIPAPIATSSAPSLRARLGLPSETCIFGSFGVVSHTKQLTAALEAFAEVHRVNPNTCYLIVGEWSSQDVDASALAARFGLGDAIRLIGFAPTLPEFLGWLAAVDVVVNLRAPTVGETSAVALRALAAGRALIVYDHGWYSELPNDVCVRLPPLDGRALRESMAALARDEAWRAALGAAGRAYAQREHAPDRAASAYVAFAERVLAHIEGRSR